MTDENQMERAETLASRAVDLFSQGQAEEGSRSLREAASLAPEHPNVKAAYEKIRKDDSRPILQQLCSRFLLDGDERAGQDAVQYLSRSAEVSTEVARECMELTMSARNVKNVDLQDEILAGLLRESPTAKAILAKRLQRGAGSPGTTITFRDVYALGDGAANGITAVVLDPSAWSDEGTRLECEKDVFQLYLAKLMEVGHDHEGRAMKGVARLLAADASTLHELIDEETFDVVLATLDYRNPVDLKSQATLVTAKYLEASENTGQAALKNFVTKRVARQQNDDLVMAFSAAAAVFPVARAVAASLFLVEGFLPSLIPLLEKKAKSTRVEHAALEMLSAACVDSACREAITKHCVSWIREVLENSRDERAGLAAVTLAKLANPSLPTSPDKDKFDNRLDSLVSRLRGMLLDNSQGDKPGSVEGLAYASANPRVKEKLASDPRFLKELLQILSTGKEGTLVAFGCLNLINNLTKYLPSMSEEQKKMSELKAYANASKPSMEPDPLDQEAAVSRRCKLLIDAGVVSAIVRVSKTLSPASITLVFSILLSLSWPQSHRGLIAQQGGAKLLLQLYTKVTSTSPESVKARSTAANALARILTSVNPTLIFPASGYPSLNSTIRPIVSLLSTGTDSDSSLPFVSDDSSNGPRDLLPAYEALLALANLLVAPSSSTATSNSNSTGVPQLIIRLAMPTIESLILHSNTNIRRAATQILPNLAQHSPGLALFADTSSPDATGATTRRLHILLALSGSEDIETRKAAGGALAMVTEAEGAVKAILGMDRGVILLLGIFDDLGDEEMVYRGAVTLGNMISAEGEVGKEARRKLKEGGAADKLRAVVGQGKGGAGKSELSEEVKGVVEEILTLLEEEK